jgi:hypothetical protein
VTWSIAPQPAVPFTDAKGHRQNPEPKMVMALKEMQNGPGETLPLQINWVSDCVLMNDYEDAESFVKHFSLWQRWALASS